MSQVGRQSQGEPIRETFVDTAVARFHYARAGTGPPVLLLPGAGGWKLTFQGMIGVLGLASAHDDSCQQPAHDLVWNGGSRRTGVPVADLATSQRDALGPADL